ncbi:MAG TPA: 4-(cytidine 5'-diphospho)-2-C-methyl-D-erythritol kinase [Bacteroidales bacterium]|nr:4-(cytidine 5'-diphospho)-2-C-methyl-D-erythritol kinase [Bacteroidales bacterium]HRR93032.1 4-(cytidine 5'-diphospho)-2-C-methyl-D-erythritol kinase [Bacteroidales bacterium]HRT90525.1 4-(cytidine 5'-diphospho)-2-C-methyl-D-erythritol kinase [Bacteroidales bacterium]
MVIFPHAKINIGLWITSKRPDGYHNIKTIFYPLKNFCDVLEFVVPSANNCYDNLTLSGIPVGPDTSENIVLKALSQMRKHVKIPYLDIHLHKAIPPGAGLGGGSSDAASFITALNKHFRLGLSNEDLSDIALATGSDCPFFITGTPAYAEGRGEILTPADHLKEKLFILVLWPGIHVSTREAYDKCTPKPREESLTTYFRLPPEEWKHLITNDFEESVFLKHPLLAEIKERLYSSGSLYSAMSGSGSAVYGIYRDKPVIPAGLEKMVVYSGLL